MKIGVFTVLFQDKAFEDMLDVVKSYDLDAIELGTGNYPGNAHCNPDELLCDENKLNNSKKAVESRDLLISALSCHGNPLHPQKDVAKKFHDVWRKTVLLAEKLGVECINVFSGCPGDSDRKSTRLNSSHRT